MSGSTLLLRLIGTSKNASIFPHRSGEGQFLEEITSIMREDAWNETKKIPWDYIKKVYEKNWDLTKPVLDSFIRSGIIVDDSDIFHLEATKFPTSCEEEVQIIIKEWN